ncbi:hypothetical protein SAMN05428977_101733 [Nitrosomonas sp. Nm166]|nr:hypothetical protein SAMN05428977_101733 [Nitrosomonas sp. Nm166]
MLISPMTYLKPEKLLFPARAVKEKSNVCKLLMENYLQSH